MSIDSSSKAALHKGYKHWCPEVEQREDWDKDFNFVLIRSIEELKKLDVEHKFVAWDTETSGLNPDIDWLVGFSFSFDGKTGYYVPVKHDDIALGKEALDIFFSILSKAGTQFLYNCRFDQRFFEAAGYSLEGLRYYDVMNAIWLADTNVLMPSLKASERRFLGWIPKTFSETLGDATTFQHVPAEDAYKYACLAEDTLVTTDQGHEKISEISVGTLVDTSEGFKEVTATYDNGIREVLEVSLDGNLIECTPDHLLAVNTVLGPSYMRADELLPCASGYRGTGEIRELRSTKSVRREVFQDFHLMYYLLGLAWADGWMNHEKNSLSFHSSVKEQEFFTDFAKRFGTASVRVRKDLRKSPSGSMVRGIDLTLISPHLEEFFIQHGYTCNKPSRVYKDIPDNYFSDFLRGLYDGDGSSNHHTMVFMCHEALKDVLVNDIHRLFGILPTKSYFRHNVWSVSYGHSSSFLLWKSLYSTSSAFMQRKRDNAVCGKKRFLRAKDSSGVERVFHSVSEAAKFYHVCVSSLSHVAVGDRCHHKGICASYDTDFQSLLEIPEDIRCVVKPVGNRHVYDLQVKDVHNFRLANGIISHNCTDALGTYHLALISNQFYKESYPASKYDNDALYPMMRLENTPQRLDLEYLKSLCSSVETRIDESLQQVYQLAGCTFNVNSPAQFGKIMLERFGVDTGVRTPTGAMKADLKTLEAWMVKHGSKASPEVKDFLSAYKEYKKTVKFKSSYLDKYIKAAEDSDTFPIRFSYKFQSVPCLTENNTVLTKSRGFVSIKDVQSDDMIWTAWGYKRVLWNHSHEVAEFYRVILKNGMTLEGTGHHPVLVRKSPLEKVEYSGMTKDDVEWAGIQDLKPDEPVVINHTPASLSCQDSWKSSLARIIGYFYGKGKMTDGVLMSLCFDNPDLAYHYYGWMKSLFGDKKVSRYDVDKGKVEYSITRQTLAKFLVEHDVIPTVEEDRFGNLKVSPVSTYTKVADRLSRMPDTFRHFLAGYLDSAKTSVRELGYKEIPEDWDDGITKDRVTFVIPSACKDVIIPMFWTSAIDCKVTDHTFKTWFGEGKVTRVEVSDPYSLSNLLSLWNNQDVGLARFSCVELPKTFRLYAESRVQSVERVPTKNTVYDIEVEDVHEFVAGGIVTHNTGRLSCGGDKKNSFFTQNNVQSTPKPHSLMVKGRKATQEEIDKGKDILGWYLSNDIPDDEAVGLVEGMDPDHFNLRRAFLPKDDDCYVVSIDMKAEELRLVANIYNEKTWADAFIHGKDVHKACYSPDTEFLVLDRGWMTADRITKGMKIAYYDPMDDEVRFTKAGERYSHEASEVYMHPTLFNVTDNHRMWIGTQDAGFRIVRASELKSQGNPKQKFRMKTAVGQRKSFQSIESHFGRKLGQYFCYGFMYFAPHYYDEEGFVHITLDSPCTKVPHDFALFLHSGDFSSTEFSVDRELSLGFRSLEVFNPCTSLFSLAKTKYKDEPIFLQDFVYGMLVYLSSTKFNTLNLGDGSKVSGKVVVSSKEHADAIQWLLMLTGSTCRVDPSKSSLYGEGDYVLTIFSDVSSLPKSLGSTFGSVKQKNIAEKHLTYSCFSVPSGLLVTRYKGQITVNGNTAIKLFGEENYSKEARKKAKCLSGETLVQTSYGVLTLRSLYDGWKSGTYREDLKIATPSGMHHVLDVMNNGTKDVLCLNMSNGDTLEATPDHLVRSGNKWVPVSSLNEGDCIDADICLSEVKVYPQIPLSFVSGCFIPLNRDLAYLFGAVLGDGTIQKKNVYYFSEDEELLSEIERIVKGLGFEPRRNLHRIGKNGKPFFRISCGASRCREIFVGAGLVGDTGHKLLCVPDVVFKSPSECRFSFLQGIFDTDGTVSKLGNATSCGLCFCTSSQVFAKQCAMLCRSLGMMCLVSSDFNKTYNRTYYKVRIRASSVRQFVSLGGFKCVHKQNTLTEWLDAGLCLKTYKKHYCIQSISSGVREVFDVSVDSEEHAFLANGLVVHNCASFGILYGSGAQGFNSSFPEMSLDECRQFLAKFKEALPSIEQGQAENVSYAREHGTINTGYGRQRRVRSYFQSGDKAQIAFAERTVKNSVVQGTAADVLKLIFCRLWANVFKPYPDVTFMSTIHDEVNFSMPKRLAREVIPICMECMTIRRDDWPVTLECSLSIGRDSLGDLIPFTYNKETKEFIPEWEESSEVLKKRTGHVETESSDNESLDVEESDDPYFGLPPEACEF